MRTRDRAPAAPARTRDRPAPVTPVVTGRTRSRGPVETKPPVPGRTRERKSPEQAHADYEQKTHAAADQRMRTRGQPARTEDPPTKRGRPGIPARAKWWKTGMPDSWPNGSAFMRNPTQPGYYKNYQRKWGDVEEDDPNLLGRWVREGDGYKVWRWNNRTKEYAYVGTYANFNAALAPLRPH